VAKSGRVLQGFNVVLPRRSNGKANGRWTGLLSMCGQDLVRTMRQAKEDVRGRIGLYVTLLLVLLFGTILLIRFETNSAPWLLARRGTTLGHFAAAVREWGEFVDTVFFTSVCFLAGAIFRRRDWRAVAVAAFLAAVFAGVSIDAMRVLAGRPRPTQFPETAWRGPARRDAYHSFPSGHTGTSIACGTALLVGAGWLGVPAAANALLMGWSSVYHANHYPSDVLFAAGWGCLVGWVMARAARRLGRASSLDPPAEPTMLSTDTPPQDSPR